MPIVVTERPQRELSLRPPWTGRRVFDVTGVTSEVEAASATDAVDPSMRIPPANEGWPGSPLLLCRGPVVTAKVGHHYEVVAEYGTPENGFWQGNPSPLDEQPTISASEVSLTEMVDQDVEGNPFVNSAGFPLAAQQEEIIVDQFDYERNEPMYDVVKFGQYRMRVNDRDLELMGLEIPKGKLLCTSILATRPFAIDATFVRIRYRFLVALNLDERFFSDWRFMDVGDRAWGNDGGTKRAGPIVSDEGVGLGSVRLDGTGKPIQTGTTMKVAGVTGRYAAVSPPSEHELIAPPQVYAPGVDPTYPWAEGVYDGSQIVAAFCHFRRRQSANFAVLLS